MTINSVNNVLFCFLREASLGGDPAVEVRSQAASEAAQPLNVDAVGGSSDGSSNVVGDEVTQDATVGGADEGVGCEDRTLNGDTGDGEVVGVKVEDGVGGELFELGHIQVSEANSDVQVSFDVDDDGGTSINTLKSPVSSSERLVAGIDVEDLRVGSRADETEHVGVVLLEGSLSGGGELEELVGDGVDASGGLVEVNNCGGVWDEAAD